MSFGRLKEVTDIVLNCYKRMYELELNNKKNTKDYIDAYDSLKLALEIEEKTYKKHSNELNTLIEWLNTAHNLIEIMDIDDISFPDKNVSYIRINNNLYNILSANNVNALNRPIIRGISLPGDYDDDDKQFLEYERTYNDMADITYITAMQDDELITIEQKIHDKYSLTFISKDIENYLITTNFEIEKNIEFYDEFKNYFIGNGYYLTKLYDDYAERIEPVLYGLMQYTKEHLMDDICFLDYTIKQLTIKSYAVVADSETRSKLITDIMSHQNDSNETTAYILISYIRDLDNELNPKINSKIM